VRIAQAEGRTAAQVLRSAVNTGGSINEVAERMRDTNPRLFGRATSQHIVAQAYEDSAGAEAALERALQLENIDQGTARDKHSEMVRVAADLPPPALDFLVHRYGNEQAALDRNVGKQGQDPDAYFQRVQKVERMLRVLQNEAPATVAVREAIEALPAEAALGKADKWGMRLAADQYGTPLRGRVFEIRTIYRSRPQTGTRLAAIEVLDRMDKDAKPTISGQDANQHWKEMEQLGGSLAHPRERLLRAVEHAHNEIAKGKVLKGTAIGNEQELTDQEIADKIFHVIKAGGATPQAAAALARATVLGNRGNLSPEEQEQIARLTAHFRDRVPAAEIGASDAKGGLDFAAADNIQVETTKGGVKLSGKAAVNYLVKGQVAGARLVTVAIKY
jgi:hypothetical protein